MRVKILLTGGVKFAAIAVVFVCASAALSPSRAAKPQTNSTNAAQTNASPQPNSNVTSQTESRATAQTNSNTTPQPQSEAERFVLEQVLLGNRVDLKKKFPQSSNERQLRGEFLKALLTSTEINSKVPISISNAVIPHQFDLAGAEVHPDVQFIDCVFVGPLQFDKSHFNGNLLFLNSDLRLGIELNQATIDQDLMLANCQVLQIGFLSLNVGRDLFLGGDKSFIRDPNPKLKGLTTGGRFSLAGTHFTQLFKADFQELQIKGSFSVEGTTFSGGMQTGLSGILGDYPRVSLTKGHFRDLLLNGAVFESISVLDLSGVEADAIAFDNIQWNPRPRIDHRGMTFQLIKPTNEEGLRFLLTPYDKRSYTDLDDSLRRQGYSSEADNVFIAGKRAERRQACASFWTQCTSKGGFLGSVFLDWFIGYGKQLQRLLWWSLAFIVFGTIVFFREDGMRTQDWKDSRA